MAKSKYPEPLHRIVAKLPLHSKQQEVWDAFFSGKYRNFVINAGRRFGKSSVCLAIAIELAVNYGQKVWWVGKTYKDAGKQYRDTKEMLKDTYTKKNEVDRRLEFYYDFPDGSSNRGEIVFRSADKPDNLRGDGLDLLIIDEAAFQSQDVWTVMRPSLMDRQGNAIFISTPNGHNWFYTFYQKGIPENRAANPGWWSRHYTSYDNELVPKEEIDKAKADATNPTAFRQEQLAEFIDDIGKVFTNVRTCAVSKMQDIPRVPGHYSMGIDLAAKHDATVVSIIDLKTNEQVFMMRMIGDSWDMQRAKIIAQVIGWNPEHIFADATGVGQPVLEELQKYIDIQITPFVMTSASKPPLIQKLAVKLQTKQIAILSDETDEGRIQIDELMSYEIKQSENGLRWSYSAPKGGNDDTVIALALAVQGITDKLKVVLSAPNPFFPVTVLKKEPDVFEEKSIKLNEYAMRARQIQKELIEEMEKSHGYN